MRRKETDIETKRSRLLAAFLAGHVQKEDYERKADELRIEVERVRRELAQGNQLHQDLGDAAVKVFDMTQRAAETWLGSCGTARRELLDVLFTNRLADDVSLSMTWRCPFDAVVESAKIGDGVANRRSHVPNVVRFAEAFGGWQLAVAC